VKELWCNQTNVMRVEEKKKKNENNPNIKSKLNIDKLNKQENLSLSDETKPASKEEINSIVNRLY